MREEKIRILRLVEQGRLRPEEAASLLEALEYPESAFQGEAAEGRTTEQATADRPKAEEGDENVFDRVSKSLGEAFKGIDWQGLQETIKGHTQRVSQEVKRALDEIEKGDWPKGFRWGPHASAKREISFQVSPGQTMRVEIPAGDVEITGGFDGGRVEAEATLRAPTDKIAQEMAQGWTLMVEQSEEAVVIRPPSSDPHTSATIDLKIEVPTGVSVEVKTGKGDVKIVKTGASTRVNAGSGDIEVEGARGSLALNTAHGDISMNDFEGSEAALDSQNGDISAKLARAQRLTARSAKGDIDLDKAASQDVTVETISGDVSIDLSESLHGSLVGSSVSGDVAFQMPDGGDCQVSLTTVMGDLECGLPVREADRQRQRFTAICGNGTGSLRLSTVHGDVSASLRATDSEPQG